MKIYEDDVDDSTGDEEIYEENGADEKDESVVDDMVTINMLTLR